MATIFTKLAIFIFVPLLVKAKDNYLQCKEKTSIKPQDKPIGYLSAWSNCSQECDGGFRTREIKCLKGNENLSVSECGFDIQLINTTCNQHSCPLQPMLVCHKSVDFFIQQTEKVCQVENLPGNLKTGSFALRYNNTNWICGGEDPNRICQTPNEDRTQWITLPTRLPYMISHVKPFDLGNEQYWIIGGRSLNLATGYTYHLDTSLIFKDGNFENGPILPQRISYYCLAQVNKTFGVLSGTYKSEGKVFLVNGSSKTLSYIGDRLETSTFMTACGWYRNTNEEIEIVFSGGYVINTKTFVDTTEIFSLRTRTWRYSNPMPMLYARGLQFQLNGYFYLLGGNQVFLKFQNGKWTELNVKATTSCVYPTIVLDHYGPPSKCN